MKIIDKGLEGRILEVSELTSEDTAVLNAERLFDKYFAECKKILGDSEVVLELESAVNQLRFAEIEAGYRVGLSDGVQLQQEINAMRKETVQH